jgi:opacity protein-like surface antigen
MWRFSCHGFLLLSLLALPALAKGTVYDKSQYHLFFPVPADKLREMNTDSPDKTEGPYTVDAGHYQVEFDLVTYTYDRNKKDNTRTNAHTVFAPNFRIGLYDALEFDVIMTSYNSVRTKDTQTGESTRNQGFDDTVVRFKYNFWGNEGDSKTALGIIPFVKIPTNHDNLGNNFYEGGVILPLNLTLTDKVSLGLMTEIDCIRGDSVKKYVANFVNSASLGYDFSDNISGFIELYTERSSERKSKWDVTLDLGLGYNITDNLTIHTGTFIGLTRQADNITPFLGMACRF